MGFFLSKALKGHCGGPAVLYPCSLAGELPVAGNTVPRSPYQRSCVGCLEEEENAAQLFQKLLIARYFAGEN